MKLAIFTMGGTIDKVYFDDLSAYEVGEPQAGEILREAGADLDFELIEIVREDSLRLTDDDRARLRAAVAAHPAGRVIVTHGTDTMVETARALEGLPGKTVVLVGALSPARFKGSDAPFNLGCAVAAAQCQPPGVYVAMSGRVFPAEKVRKNREAGRFESA